MEHNIDDSQGKKKLHKTQGPAAIYGNNEYWYDNGKRHRYGGPAISEEGKASEYYIYGARVTPRVNDWLSERGYIWEDLSEQEKWELELFMRMLG